MKDFTKKVWAFTLGDGALSNLKRTPRDGSRNVKGRKDKNSYYYLRQIETHKDYIDWQAEILSDLTKVTTSYENPYTDSRGYNCKGKYKLSTMVHPFYTKLRERIYLNGIKAIDPHYLKLLDWEALAILFMDDGWTEIQRNKSGTYIRIGISTHNYTYGDNYLLSKAIVEKVGVHFDVKRHKQKSGTYLWYLRTSKDNALRFIEGIYKFVLPSFSYKVNLSNE